MALEYLSAIRRGMGDLPQARGYLMEAHRRQPHLPASRRRSVWWNCRRITWTSLPGFAAMEKDPGLSP